MGIYLQLSSVSGAILCRNSGFIFGLLFCFFKHSNNNDNNEVLNPTCWHKLHEFLCLKRKKKETMRHLLSLFPLHQLKCLFVFLFSLEHIQLYLNRSIVSNQWTPLYLLNKPLLVLAHHIFYALCQLPCTAPPLPCLATGHLKDRTSV